MRTIFVLSVLCLGLAFPAAARIPADVVEPPIASVTAIGGDSDSLSLPGDTDDAGRVIAPGEYGFMGLDDDDGDGEVDVDPLE